MTDKKGLAKDILKTVFWSAMAIFAIIGVEDFFRSLPPII